MARILIIDDSHLARVHAREVLADTAHQVIDAATCADGLAALRRERPDAIILDLLMPEMDGRALLHQIREHDPTIPVIVQTADSQPKTREECLALGAAEVINKFSGSSDLRDAVANAVGHTSDVRAPLSPEQVTSLGGLINAGVQQAGDTLNRMLDTTVVLETPRVELAATVDMESILATSADALVGVRLPFHGGLSGHAALVFPRRDAVTICDGLMQPKDQSEEMDATRAGTIKEVGNVVLNAVMTIVADGLDDHLRYSMPTYHEGDRSDMLPATRTNGHAVVAYVSFLLETQRVEGKVVLYLDVNSLEPLAAAISGGGG